MKMNVSAQPGSLIHRLRKALLALALIPLLLGFAILLLTQGIDRHDSLRQTYERRSERVAEMVDIYLREAQEHLGQAQRFWNYDALPEADKARILRDILAAHGEFVAVDYLSASAEPRLRVARNDASGMRPSAWRDEAAVMQALKTEATSFGQVVVDVASAEPALIMAMPVKEPGNGRVVGLLAAEITFKPVWRNLARLVQGTADDAFVLSEESRLVAHQNPSVVLAEKRYVPPSSSRVSRDLDGRLALVTVRQVKVPGSSLTVVLTRTFVSAYGVLLFELGVAFSILLATLALALVLLKRLAAWLIEPIVKLTEAADRIRADERDVRVQGSFVGEVATLADTFNLMLDRLRADQSTLELRVRERTADLREASQVAEQSRRMLQTVLDTIPLRIYWKDRDLIYLGGNALFARDAGVASPQELVEKSDHDLAWSGRADLYRADDRKVISSGNSILAAEVLHQTDEGHGVWLRTSKVPLRNAVGDVIGLLGVYDDISDEKRAALALQAAKEEAERANLAKSEFLSRMSHELRTPLNAIIGFAQILAIKDKASLTERQVDNVQEIIKAGQQLLLQVNEVLDLARIESGRIDLAPCAVKISLLVNECIAQVQPLASARDIVISSEIDRTAGKDLELWADKNRLKQVLLNLLSNAIKYNRHGGSVQITSVIAGDQLRVLVSDTGRGVAADKRQRLFLPFERLESSYDGIEGTGMGLALVKRLVEAMGGAIGVESQIEIGSTFWFSLPVVVSANKCQASAGVSGNTEDVCPEINVRQLESQKRSVLYIEDNPSNVKLVRKMIGLRNDITLVDAPDAESGIEFARRTRPDLILLDINLPGMDGFEALRALGSIPETAAIPVLAISANAMKRDVDRAAVAGFAGYLTKPIDVNSLFEAMDRCLRRAKENLN